MRDNVLDVALDCLAVGIDPSRETRYRRGGLGDVTLKRRLIDVLHSVIAPIRERRAIYARDGAAVLDIVRDGTQVARFTAADTLRDVRGVFALGF